MKICFIVRSLYYQLPSYTTVHLAYEAYRRGHEVFLTTIDGLSYQKQTVFAAAKTASHWDLESREAFLEHLQRQAPRVDGVDLGEFDVVFLRHNVFSPSWNEDPARSPAIEFGRILKQKGVRVYNDPEGLTRTASKLYLTSLPNLEDITAKTLVSRNLEEIRAFVEKLGQPVVMKPLYGSGGRDVFYVQSESDVNLQQIVATISKTSYVLVQEYLPAASQGDKRILLLNGAPIVTEGKVALYGRRPKQNDIRSNMSVGGQRQVATFTATDQLIIERIRPHLFEDGLFFVGADIVGNKLLELNVFCPGGIHNINELLDVNLGDRIIEELEGQPKVWYVPESSITKQTQ